MGNLKALYVCKSDDGEMCMDRKEFLRELREYLEGGIPEFEIISHITYYNEYFDQRISDGVTEEEVLKELGDPRLIAKTLIDTSNMSTNKTTKHYDYDYSQEYEENDLNNNKNKTLKQRIKEWLIDMIFGRKEIKPIHKILAVISIVVIIGIIFVIFTFLLNFIVAMLPIILILWVIYIIINEKKRK